MATGKALDGKPYAGNPHVRFDEGEVASAATPRRGSLLYKKKLMTMLLAAGAALGAWAANVRVYVNAPSAVAWGDNWFCYAWDDNGAPLLGAWPGTQAVKTEVRESVTWHYVDVTANGDFGLIFSDGNGKQTEDLDITGASDAKAYFIEVNSSANESGRYLCQIVNVGVVTSTHGKVQLWEDGPYWAETNIGADEPWDSGYYFWWGDTVGYKREGGKWVASDGSNSDFSFSEANTPTYGKDPATLLSEGWITADGVLAPEHDAAHVQWGDGWRMPTYQEMYALTTKCNREWVTTNGVKGYVFRGKGDYSANSIFLPVTGIGTTTSFGDFDSGCYWSSGHQSDPYLSVQFWFGSGFLHLR